METTSVHAKIVRIGNSRGIRIPRVLIEQAGLNEEVEIQVKGNQLIIQSSLRPRQGWEKSFFEMSQREEDRLLDEPLQNEWDNEEWTW
jgi:antitoxin MazE